MTKHRILVLYDIAKQTDIGLLGWAYYRRAKSLADHCPDDMQIDIGASDEFSRSSRRVGEYDLIYLLEYAHARLWRRTLLRNNIEKPLLVVSHNSDRHRRHELWNEVMEHSDFVVANNRCVWDFFKGPSRTCNISNGVDEDCWHCDVPIADRPHKVLWCGSSSAKKRKGFQDVLMPARGELHRLGFECDFRPIDDINPDIVYPTEKQAAWYNSGSYVVCASGTEGTPNTSLEGMACGCVLVTTLVGNAKEFARHGENCVVFNRSPQGLIDALTFAREHCERLASAGMATMEGGWWYGEPGNRAQYFYQLWRRLIQDGPESVKPFSYMDKHWSDI